RDDYAIVQIDPPPGKREEVRTKILEKKNSNIVAVERNILVPHSQATAPPNDPNFPSQWNFAVLRWPQAQAAYMNSQVKQANITILASGCTPVTANNELGPYITQYNAMVNPPKQEAVYNSGIEGSLDCSLAGELTNNSSLLAGLAC